MDDFAQGIRGGLPSQHGCNALVVSGVRKRLDIPQPPWSGDNSTSMMALDDENSLFFASTGMMVDLYKKDAPKDSVNQGLQ